MPEAELLTWPRTKASASMQACLAHAYFTQLTAHA
jgi:hypothetical protein